MRANILVSFSFLYRFWWLFEVFQIDMDKFKDANNNRGEEFSCVVLEADKSISVRFVALDTSDLKKLSIVSRVHITTDQPQIQFYLQCTDIIIPSNPNTFQYWIGNVPLTNNFSVAQFTDQPAIGTIDPIMKKMYLSIGSNLEIQLTLMSSKVDLQGSLARILISFPFYYQPRLSKDDIISCNILQPVIESVTCYLIDTRLIEIRYFKTPILKDTRFQISIRGVTQPLVYTQETFFIYIDSDDDNDNYDEYYSILDIRLNSQITSILNTVIEVNKLTIKSNYLREESVKYQFDIFIPTKAPNINFGSVIMVSFPNIYDQPLRVNFDLQCSINLLNSTDFNFCSFCIVSGLRIKLYVSDTILSGQSYSIIIHTLRNPGRFDAFVSKWVIEVTDEDENYIIMRSFDSTVNYVIDNFIQNPYQSYINFYDSPLTNPNSKVINTINLIKGVLSDWIYIRPINSDILWKQSFTLTSRYSQIRIISAETHITLGTNSESRLRIYSEDAIGEYDFQIYKYGDSNFYSDLNTIRLKFSDKNIIPLTFTISTFEVYASVSKFDLYLQISSQIYLTNIDFTFSVQTTGNPGIKLGDSQVQLKVSFNEGVMIGKLPIIILDKIAFSSIPKVTIQVSMSGINASSYKLNTNTIQIQSLTDPLLPIQLNLVEKVSANYINYKEFEFSCNHKGYFYYHVSLYYQENDSACQLTKDKINSTAWNISQKPFDNPIYPCDNRFGVFYVDSQNTQTFQINDLQAQRNYQISGYCNSQLDKSTDIQIIKFKQQQNNGKLFKIQIDLIKQPTIDQIIKVLCYLSIHFNQHPNYVSTLDGLTCKELSKRRLFNQQISFNLFSRSITSESDQKRKLIEKMPLFDSSKCTEPNIIKSNSKMYHLNIYIDANEFIKNDQTPTKIMSDTSSGCFVSYSNMVLLGVSDIIHIHQGILVDYNPPQAIFDDVKSVYVGQTWVHINGIKLSSTFGRLWGVLVKGNDDIKIMPRQIRAGQNGRGDQALSLKSQDFDFVNIKEFNVTFVGLQQGQSYKFHFVVANENPFQSIQYSSVHTISFQTISKPMNSNKLNQNMFVFLLLFILIHI